MNITIKNQVNLIKYYYEHCKQFCVEHTENEKVDVMFISTCGAACRITIKYDVFDITSCNFAINCMYVNFTKKSTNFEETFQQMRKLIEMLDDGLQAWGE